MSTQRKNSIRVAALAAAAATVACTSSIFAQAKGERSNPVQRAECLQIEQQVKAGSTDHLLLASLQHCDETGPRVLVDKWRDPPTDYSMLYALMGSSGVLHDRRLLVSLVGVATDPSKLALHREAAIASTVSFIDQRYAPYLAKDPLVAGGLRVGVAMVDHPRVSAGSEPLASADVAMLRRALTALATRDASRSVRELASRVVNASTP